MFWFVLVVVLLAVVAERVTLAVGVVRVQ